MADTVGERVNRRCRVVRLGQDLFNLVVFVPYAHSVISLNSKIINPP